MRTDNNFRQSRRIEGSTLCDSAINKTIIFSGRTTDYVPAEDILVAYKVLPAWKKELRILMESRSVFIFVSH